jgi:hypothetical protein
MTWFMSRMSRCRLPGLAVWPPMLKCPPPTDSGPSVRRIASATSATVFGLLMAQTATGFRPVTSLTINVFCCISGPFFLPPP